MPRPAGIRLVARRELRRISRRPALAFLTLAFPLLVFLVLSLIFRAGVPTLLPVAVLDEDLSGSSRQIIQAIAAAPEVRITHRPADMAAAQALIRQGQVYGLVRIGAGLERDLRAGRQPEVAIFFNNQMMTPGGTVARALEAAVSTASAGLAAGIRMAAGESRAAAIQATQPIPLRQSPLFNPTLDYVHFLLAMLMPAALHILICAGSAYVVGQERQQPGGLARFARLGGGILPALVGKLLPHTAAAALMLALGDLLLFTVYGMPLRGSLPLYLAGSLVFILAYQCAGVALGLLAPDIPSALGGAGILTAPAFGFTGASFPRIAMGSFAYGFGALLPLTWYLELRSDQFLRGVPMDMSLPVLGRLCLTAAGMALLALLAVWLRRPAARPARQTAGQPA